MREAEFEKYLRHTITCGCGKNHSCSIDRVIIEEDAIEMLPKILEAYTYQRICIIEDCNTEAVAGRRVAELLAAAEMPCQTICFPDSFLIPDEAALGKIMIEIDRDTDLILAVGSGTMNDICKFVSYQMRIDYFIIATAPSMDGYASNVAPLISNHAKTTYEVGMPKVIVGDLTVMSRAPMPMIAAGVGDILGKYVCLMDWKMAYLVQGEYYCAEVEKLVRMSIEKVMDGVDKLQKRDRQAVGNVMEGLVLSGIAMSYVGNSRPASGSEHHLSHYWEMMALLKNGHIELHGTKVAIGTMIGLKLYELLQTVDFANIPPKKETDSAKWEEEIRKVYGLAADAVIALENNTHKNAPERVAERRKAFESVREEIMEEAAELPKAERIIAILISLDGKYLPSQIGVEEQTVRDSIFYAKELRNRYGILQVLFDYDLQEVMSESILEYFR